MVLVIPNDRWLGNTIRVPHVGRITRNGKEAVDVSDLAAKWLVNNCFARLAGEGQATVNTTLPDQDRTTVDSSKNPAVTAPGENSSGTSTEQNQSDLEAWQQQAITFLNSESLEAIIAIDGISPKVAETLHGARPLDWKKTEQLLTKAQITALRKWAESQASQ